MLCNIPMTTPRDTAAVWMRVNQCTTTGNYCDKAPNLNRTILQCEGRPKRQARVARHSVPDVSSRLAPVAHLEGKLTPTYCTSQSVSWKEIHRQTLLTAGHEEPRLLMERLELISLLDVTPMMPLFVDAHYEPHCQLPQLQIMAGLCKQ